MGDTERKAMSRTGKKLRQDIGDHKKALAEILLENGIQKKNERFRAQVIAASSIFGEMQYASGTAKLQLIHSGNGSDCALGMAIRSGL